MKIDNWFVKLYQWSKSPSIIAAAIFFFLLIISFGTTNIGMSYDEGQWNYIGRAWLEEGVPPYAGAVENKNAGIYLLYGVSNLLFGMNFWFPRMLGILSLSLCAVLIFKIVRYLHSHFAASLAMIFFGFGITWQSAGGIFTAETESFMIPFILLAIYVMLRLKDQPKKNMYVLGLFASGFLIGIAIYFKQIATISIPVLYGFYFNYTSKNSAVSKNILRDCLTILAGLCLFATIGLIPIFRSGLSFTDYIDGAWLILVKEGNPIFISFGKRIVGFVNVFKRSELILFYPLLFVFLIQRRNILSRGIPFLGILLWIGLDFLAINVSGTYSSHHLKLIMPSLSIASSIGLCSLLEKDFIAKRISSVHRGQIILIILILWVPIYFQPVVALRNILSPPHQQNRAITLCKEPFSKPNDNDCKQLGLWIKKVTEEDDLVYIAGYGATIQAYSERISPTRFYDGMFLNVKGANQQLKNDLVRNMPKLVLIPKFHEYKIWVSESNRRLIEDFVQEYYRKKTCYYGYDIYVRD